jgi:hypothetical protein
MTWNAFGQNVAHGYLPTSTFGSGSNSGRAPRPVRNEDAIVWEC